MTGHRHAAALPAPRRRYVRAYLTERFAAYTLPEPNSGCWLWDGSCDRHGYGQLRISRSVLKYATHVALELDGRPVPKGLYVCHHCDNPPCVNPAHLFIGTQADNMADSLRKGRASKPPVSKPGQGAQEFCAKGHLLSGDNAYLVPGTGWKHCRECKRQVKAKRRARFAAMGLRCDGLPRAVRT